jgi:hypothetical protein
MDRTRFERQLADDLAALLEILPGLARLEAGLEQAREQMSPRARGYFTPQEDDEVRQLLLAYRNYRRAIWELIHRYRHYDADDDRELRLRGMVVGYAAALALYRRSLRVVELVEDDRMLRSKLNEGDAKFGLAPGFFEDVLLSYTSIYNYFKIARARLFWATQRRRLRALAAEPPYARLIESAVEDRRRLDLRFWALFGQRLRRDWKAALRRLLRPLKLARYGSQAALSAAIAGVRLPAPDRVRGLSPEVLATLHAELRPGDVLLMRAEDKITAALLPGFWAHAAIYAGGLDDLRAAGLAETPWVQRRAAVIAREDQGQGVVLEAISRGVRINPLAYSLQADHVAVLRPRLPPEEVAAALREAFGHVGKAYDFEFDFNVSSRLVCTGLVWRAYDGRGAIRFSLVKRLGRYTLTGDDVAAQFLQAVEAGTPGFDLVALWLQDDAGPARRVPDAQALARLRALRGGSDERAVPLEPVAPA